MGGHAGRLATDHAVQRPDRRRHLRASRPRWPDPRAPAPARGADPRIRACAGLTWTVRRPTPQARVGDLTSVADAAAPCRGSTRSLRDISRGGLAGILTRRRSAGSEARIVMRLDALLLPDTVGAFTSNGNRIGDITLGGTLALVLGGLFAGLQAGTIWVAISPWIPRTGWPALSSPCRSSCALARARAHRGDQPDFLLLHFDPGSSSPCSSPSSRSAAFVFAARRRLARPTPAAPRDPVTARRRRSTRSSRSSGC